MTENSPKNRAQRLKLALCIGFMLLLVCWPDTGISGARRGLAVCYETLLPSLFPFMLCCTCLSALAGRAFPGRASVPVLTAVLLGLVGGFPSGAAALSRLVQESSLSKKRAAALLCGCVNAGPAFLIGSVGLGCFGNRMIGVLLFLSLGFASALCLLFALVFIRGEPAPQKHSAACAPFTLGDGVRQTVRAVAALCGYVVLFSCAGAYADSALSLLGAGRVWQWLVRAALEVTGGCVCAGGIPGSAGALLACAGISLCGLSILLQIRGILEPGGISMRYFLLSRPVHCAVSVGMMRLLLVRFEHAVAAMATAAAPQTGLFCLSPVFSAAAFLLCCTSLLGDRRGFGFTKS